MQPIRQAICFALACALGAALALSGHLPRCCADGPANRWVDWKVCGPFVVRAEFPLAGRENLLRQLAQLQEDLHHSLGVPRAREPIEIYLFRTKSSYSSYLRQHLPKVPYRRALYVKRQGPGQVLAYWSRELPTDLRHECTHALLHAVLPMVPLWLDEGLAEFFEVPAQKRAFDNPHLARLRWNLMFSRPPKLENLEKKSDLAQMKQTEYRSSWAWVHFMLLGPEQAREELLDYLRDIGARTPPGLLSQRLQRRLPATDRYFAAHFKSWRR